MKTQPYKAKNIFLDGGGFAVPVEATENTGRATKANT